MLVLSRKENEQIRIGDNIVVTIVKVKGNLVRIGIEAPKDVRIMRSELDEKIVEESQPAGVPADVESGSES